MDDDNIVEVVREEFGKGNDRAQKFIYRTTGETSERPIDAFHYSCPAHGTRRWYRLNGARRGLIKHSTRVRDEALRIASNQGCPYGPS
jgi:hypothetical protein